MKLHAAALAALLSTVTVTAADFDLGKVVGNPAAPVQIEVFSDYSCPACKGFHETMLPILVRDYVNAGKVFVVNREFPLAIPAHKYSRQAAAWVTAAARIGKYKEASDRLFATQTQWMETGKVAETVLPLIPAAEQKKVTALAKDPGILAEVQKDVDLATAARVNQTPTLIIRRGGMGKPYSFPGPGPENYTLLKSLIDGLLK
jgi:protein-disulfide isomerase